MLRAIFLFLLTLSGACLFAQTCQINSSTSVCKEELISFDVTSSSTIQSVVWDMGDGSTYTQISFNHKYSQAGVKTVKVTVTLAGGGTCFDTKQVIVYELPQAKLVLRRENRYCLANNKVCLIDSSTSGDPALGMKKRIIIWDDGDQSVTNNPPFGSVICHTYVSAGKFKITTELTNDKDCKAKVETNVEILHNKLPDVMIDVLGAKSGICDSTRVDFYDKSTSDTSDIIGKIYQWGDGRSDTNRTNYIRHFYYNSGFYLVSLTYRYQNGCNTTRDSLLYVYVPDVSPHIKRYRDTVCFDDPCRIQQIDTLQGASYYWSVGIGTNRIFEDGKDIIAYPKVLGRNYINLRIVYEGCSRDYDKADSLEVIGIHPVIYVLNANQCDNKDTVYFLVKGERYGMGRISYLWDLDDSLAAPCTTSIKQGLNLGFSCKYSSDSFVKHKYLWGVNRTWRLYMTDLDHGCYIPFNFGPINTQKPKDYGITNKTRKKCIGPNSDYEIDFIHKLGDMVKVQINLDSARGKKFFSPRPIYSFVYQYVEDPNGWVTVGFALTFGRGKIYRSADTADYYYDSSRVCYDTIWFHNWYRLLPSPPANFVIENKCVPANVKTKLFFPVLKDIVFTSWDWGDGTKIDTFMIAAGDSVIPAPTHLYKSAGHYYPYHRVENKNGCYGRAYGDFKVGFYPFMLLSDSIICPGERVNFNDSIFYDLDTPNVNHWHFSDRRAKGIELMKWDFGDGRGFATDSLFPVFQFQNKGLYTVRLAVKDKYNCWDTLSKKVSVGGTHVGIKAVTKKIICDDIMQLFDSSFTDYPPPGDSIVKHYWEFGDLGNPSFLKDPFHFYKTFGSYRIFHAVENSRGCVDSTSIMIKIEGPISSFDIVSDTVGCAPFTAEFKNTSQKVRDYIWYFGDPLNSKLSTNRDTNVTFTYKQPGTYYIYLFGSDSVVNPNAGNAIYYCKSTFPDTSLANHPVRKIIVLPAAPAKFNVAPLQCLGVPVMVSDNSDSIYKRYKWVIKGIDSVETTNKSALLHPRDTGYYRIFFSPWQPAVPPYNMNCSDTSSKLIKVTRIQASFEVIKDTVSCPVFTFINTTKGRHNHTWNLGDTAVGDNLNIRTEDSVVYRYTSKGKFTPCLFVENMDGCRDTLCKEVDVAFVKTLRIPNVFTPNSDGFNDVFDIEAEGMEEYELTLFNRWGQIIYHSTIDGVGNDGFNWTGRNHAYGFYPEGTYFYIFKYKFKCDGISHRVEGMVTLLDARD